MKIITIQYRGSPSSPPSSSPEGDGTPTEIVQSTWLSAVLVSFSWSPSSVDARETTDTDRIWFPGVLASHLRETLLVSFMANSAVVSSSFLLSTFRMRVHVHFSHPQPPAVTDTFISTSSPRYTAEGETDIPSEEMATSRLGWGMWMETEEALSQPLPHISVTLTETSIYTVETLVSEKSHLKVCTSLAEKPLPSVLTVSPTILP